MTTANPEQRILEIVFPSLRQWVDGFLTTKRAQALSPRTVEFYREKISRFVNFAEQHYITTIEAIDPTLIREFLLLMENTGHNAGGVKSFYTCLRVFLRWYEAEAEPDGWRNPINKVKAPKVPEEILDPTAVADVWRMVETCGSDYYSLRDKAILLTLLDTGIRAKELSDLQIDDLNPVMGALVVRKGKGGKGRTVFIGQKTRRAVRAYLRLRGYAPGPLFANRSRRRLKYNGLRTMVRRRAEEAGVLPVPTLHGFRRAFALEMLRAGADLLTLQRLLGHADLSVIKRYVKQNDVDLRNAHTAFSPVDRKSEEY